MTLPKRGEKGFTLIELLIVVAILGVLAAVVIPNVGRFIGRGETEAANTEFSNIQAAVTSMMTDNNLPTLHNPIDTTRTKDMFMFPDTASVAGSANKTADPNGNPYVSGTPGDNDGYVLYLHDISGGGSNTTLVNYVATRFTKGTYTVDAQGTVTQASTGY